MAEIVAIPFFHRISFLFLLKSKIFSLSDTLNKYSFFLKMLNLILLNQHFHLKFQVKKYTLTHAYDKSNFYVKSLHILPEKALS